MIINSLLLLLLLSYLFIFIVVIYYFLPLRKGFQSLFIDVHTPMIRMASMFCSIVTFWKEKLDNTGCYLCSHLIHSLASLRECTGIKIVRYDFSDPQAGKYLFDRRTATVQSHVCCNINEGHDSKSASDIQWPVEGCQASITLLRVKSQARPRSTQCLGSCLEIFLASSPEV